MSIRKIIKYPDPVLRKKAQTVTSFDNGLQRLVENMADTMYNAPGVGLAAPQIGESIQVIVVHVSSDEDKQEFMPMINPEITEGEGNQVDEEGCLSVIDLTANVERKKKIRVNYQDIDGKRHEIEVEDRRAVVLQHEMDHLNGILFIDHLSPLKRNLYKKKLKKILAHK